MSDMDLDLEFDDGFNLLNDDLALIEQTEQTYLSTQQSQQLTRSSSPTDNVNRNTTARNPPTSWNVASLSSQPTRHSNVGIRPLQRTNSGISPEAEKIIEDLQFQVQRLQMNSTITNDRSERENMLLLQQKVKDKERDIIQLKMELSKYKEQSTDSQQKRSFPGINIYDKPKTRRMSTKPSPFAQPASSFSIPSRASQSSRASTPRTQDSQHIPKDTVNMPLLASLASMPAVLPTPGTIPNRSVNIKMEDASEASIPRAKEKLIDTAPATSKKSRNELTPSDVSTVVSRIPDVPSIVSRTSTSGLSSMMKGLTHAKSIPKSSDSESNLKLLNIIFEPLFQQWNSKHHRGTKNMNTSLTRDQIKEFSEQFSQQFIPDPAICGPEELERLQLLASDISVYIVKSESAKATIRQLFNIFHIWLKICIKEKLYTVIYHIVHVVGSIAESFSIARKFLYKEASLGASSLLVQLARSLVLFPFYKEQCTQLLSEHPNVTKMTLEEIHSFAISYQVNPSQIEQDLSIKKAATEPIHIVKSILDLFRCVAAECGGQLFPFLMVDPHFLSLLDPKGPYEIIITALGLLESMTEDTDCMMDYDDESLSLLVYLTNLVAQPQNSLTLGNWYNLLAKTISVLRLIVNARIPDSIAIKINQMILAKTKEALDLVAAKFNDVLDDNNNKIIRSKRDHFIEKGLETMYYSIQKCPVDIFENIDEPKPKAFVEMLSFYNTHTSSTHPIAPILAKLTRYAETRFKPRPKKPALKRIQF